MGSILTVLQAKHFWILLLAIPLSFILIDHREFSILPIWAIHTSSLSPNSGNVSVDDFVHLYDFLSVYHPDTPNLSTLLTLHFINRGSVKLSSFTTYHAPLLPDLEEFMLRTSRKPNKLHSLKHRLTKTIFSTSVRLKAGIYDGKLIYISLSPCNSVTDVSTVDYLCVTLHDADFILKWNTILNIPLKWKLSDSQLEEYWLKQPAVMKLHSQCVYNLRYCGIVIVGFPVLNGAQIQLSAAALSIKDGTEIWYHFPDESAVNSNEGELNEISNLNFWKVSILNRHRINERNVQPWKSYMFYFDQIMPLTWYGSNSTEIRLIYISKSHLPIYNPSHAPNSVAIIHSNGLTILDLKDGHSLASLSLKWNVGSTYAFFSTPYYGNLPHQNRNAGLYEIRIGSVIVRHSHSASGLRWKEPNVLEEESTSESDFSHTVDCVGLFIYLGDNVHASITENRLMSYHGLCRPHRPWEYARLGRPEWREDEMKLVSPVIQGRIQPSSGFVGLWDSLMRNEHPSVNEISNDNNNSTHIQYDIYFLTSDGGLTSISDHGYENWRTNAEVSWLQVSRTLAASSVDRPTESHLSDIYMKHFQPGLVSADIMLFGANTRWLSFVHKKYKIDSSVIPVLISTGWDSVSLVDRVHGKLLATHRLPSQPNGKPMVLPLLTNYPTSYTAPTLVPTLIVVPCNGLLMVFGLTYTIRISTLLLLVCSLVVSLILLSWCCTFNKE